MSPIDREEKAKELLKAAGYGPGGKKLTVEIRYNTSENHKNTSVALANMWKPFNVDVKFVNTDLKTHYALLRDKGDFDVARAGWIADYSDPQNFLFLAESDNKGLNYANYSQSRVRRADEEGGHDEGPDGPRQGPAAKPSDLRATTSPTCRCCSTAPRTSSPTRCRLRESNTLDRHLSRFLSIKQ